MLLGIFPELRPVYERTAEGVTEAGQVEMGRAMMIVMLAAAGLLLLLVRADPEKAIKGSVMKGGLVAIVSILGVSWMGSSFFEGNRAAIVGGISGAVRDAPLGVRGRPLRALDPALQPGRHDRDPRPGGGRARPARVRSCVGAYPAVNGNFFLPTYGTVLAAVSFDQTGTTRIGRYLLNHSFMRPGLVATATSTAVALGLARWLI